MNDTLKRKLTSRKLWMAIALFVSGVLTAIGKDSVAETVAGLIMQAAAVIAYIVGEGLVDASSKVEVVEAEDSDASLTWEQFKADQGTITFPAIEPETETGDSVENGQS